MKIGYIGLGKMGLNMVERLIEKGHKVIVFDKNESAIKYLEEKGALPAYSLKSLAASLETPRFIWLMVPYKAVDQVIQELHPFIQTNDVLVDGGNSPYEESIRRSADLKEKGIHFLDAGVSGGPAGARSGACIMIGGEKSIFDRYENIFRDLSAEKGYGYMGKSGTGHFVKMVHNGIEYGMMQAIAEGFGLLKASPFNLHLAEVAELYNHRSVIESRLLGWLRKAFDEHGEDLDNISGSVSHTGEGSWTVDAAKKFGVPVTIIEEALRFRIESQKNPSYTGKILSALRFQFGGHDVFDKKA